MSLKFSDHEVFNLIKQEEKRQQSTLNLIASENYASPTSLKVQASIFGNKLGEGFIGNRACAGCEVIDKIEGLAIERLKQIFGVDHTNVQSPTTPQANLAVYFALLKPGDVVLSPKISYISRGLQHFARNTSCRHCEGKISIRAE